MTTSASGAWPEDGAIVSQPVWLAGVPTGYWVATEITAELEAVAGSEMVSLVEAGNVVLSTV